ncbi:MAG: tyrosine-type recombinase/integrase [Polyangiales bacterium]
MIETLFERPFFLRRLRASLIGEHVDGFAASLAADGYAGLTIRCTLSATRAFGDWLSARGRGVADIDDRTAARFVAHHACANATRRSLRTGVAHFLAYLRAEGVIATVERAAAPAPALIVRFAEWMEAHRGARSSTVAVYAPIACSLLRELRGDPARLTARRVRAFVLARASEHGTSRASTVVTASRMFVRFLVADGLCDADLVAAVPTVASWRESSLPRYLPAVDVERIIASCDLAAPDGLRDRAVLLLLARLGLRAGDVAGLTFDAIDWVGARVRVAGKGRREDWLPLPQDAGDAILRYLEKGRPRLRASAVFLTARAPIVTMSRWVVSTIVRRAIHRAGVSSPSHGAHVLRHSAAATMLRAGSSLTEIGALLRHASIETTFHYAKVDRDLLVGVAAPWPARPRGARADDDTRTIAMAWPGVA